MQFGVSMFNTDYAMRIGDLARPTRYTRRSTQGWPSSERGLTWATLCVNVCV